MPTNVQHFADLGVYKQLKKKTHLAKDTIFPHLPSAEAEVRKVTNHSVEILSIASLTVETLVLQVYKTTNNNDGDFPSAMAELQKKLKPPESPPIAMTSTSSTDASNMGQNGEASAAAKEKQDRVVRTLVVMLTFEFFRHLFLLRCPPTLVAPPSMMTMMRMSASLSLVAKESRRKTMKKTSRRSQFRALSVMMTLGEKTLLKHGYTDKSRRIRSPYTVQVRATC